MNLRIFLILFLAWSLSAPASAQDGLVRIGDIARLSSAQEAALVGYGLVTGLAGTGDSPRNEATVQAIRNMMRRFGVNVELDDVRSRNVAAVMVTSTLPPFSQPGDELDVNVTSLGDARSLLGGTLLMTPLAMGDKAIYASAQGPISVGGYSYDLNGNLIQKNHPTAGQIPGGAKVSRAVDTALVDMNGMVTYKLDNPNFETANRIANAVGEIVGASNVKSLDAGRVVIRVPQQSISNIVPFLTQVEDQQIVPGVSARVVVNEKTGTVVSGGNVVISAVSVTHGNLSVAISTDYAVSQPIAIGNRLSGGALSDIRTEVVPQTDIAVTEDIPISVTLVQGSKVSDLVLALNKIRATSRDVITILQSIKRAGALHAELVVQ